MLFEKIIYKGYQLHAFDVNGANQFILYNGRMSLKKLGRMCSISTRGNKSEIKCRKKKWYKSFNSKLTNAWKNFEMFFRQKMCGYRDDFVEVSVNCQWDGFWFIYFLLLVYVRITTIKVKGQLSVKKKIWNVCSFGYYSFGSGVSSLCFWWGLCIGKTLFHTPAHTPKQNGCVWTKSFHVSWGGGEWRGGSWKKRMRGRIVSIVFIIFSHSRLLPPRQRR